MKTVKKSNKVRNKFNQDVMISYPEIPQKEIDGVVFIAVKYKDSDAFHKWIRKDSLEVIK